MQDRLSKYFYEVRSLCVLAHWMAEYLSSVHIHDGVLWLNFVPSFSHCQVGFIFLIRFFIKSFLYRKLLWF